MGRNQLVPAGKETGIDMVAVTRKFPLGKEPRGADMASLESIISVKGINKVYDGQVHALKDVDLDFPAGALTTLLGPSGCGKTTLLKIIAGLLTPTTGDVLVKGKKVTGPGPERAFVFQDFALMPWATVLRNVAFGLELRGMAPKERHDIARRYISHVGLASFEEKYPHELSGGMRQRVGLARALAVDADVLLLDEPFSAVDEQTRRKFQEDLLRLREIERKTFIFVTHSIEEAVYLSDRIVLLSRRPGRIEQIIEPKIDRSGSPDEIRRDQAYLDIVEEIWQSLRQFVD
jgi:NitT/TauT family transport system ATP-binding protein